MNRMTSFRAQLAALSDDAIHHPDEFGPGVRLLFSCASYDIIAALAEAETSGVEARGVGRLHILVEVENKAPDAEWLATEGEDIAGYFERIGAANPQIGIDRGIG